MANPLTTVENLISNVVHHTRIAVEAAVKDAEAKAHATETKIAADVRAAVAAAKTAVAENEPAIKAAVDKGITAVEAAVEAALAARGL